MSVYLRKKLNNSGSTSLYLDIYNDGKRYKEYLTHLKLLKPTNPVIKNNNTEKLKIARQIRDKKAIELQANEYGIMNYQLNKVEVVSYFENYLYKYTKKDKRNVEGVFKRFLIFVRDEGIVLTTLKKLDSGIVSDFADYLKSTCKGEGANSYFARFKKVLNKAVKDGVILKSPADGILIKKDNSKMKDVLTIEEIQLLANTDIYNKEVKSAFLFCCFTGLRWSDIKVLKWENIDLRNSILKTTQSKTNVVVEVPLNETALNLLPIKKEKEELVFDLPSNTCSLKHLRKWVLNAGIEKKITWHCARHSFGTNLIVYKNDAMIVSRLMGHSSIAQTQRYVRVANDLKKQATDNLPKINL
jgi:integrase